MLSIFSHVFALVKNYFLDGVLAMSVTLCDTSIPFIVYFVSLNVVFAMNRRKVL